MKRQLGPGSGSSPLARGLPDHSCPGQRGVGIIPARAGFTHHGGGPSAGRRDHPRSRGVYATSAKDVASPTGIIPARAGFTTEPLPRWWGFWDHPRSRGVYAGWFTSVAQGAGSSPLARGLRNDAAEPTGEDPDHPRSRGVYGHLGWELIPLPGSSPLARGLRVRHLGRPVRRRIIPARAGFTARPPPRGTRSRWIIPARAGFTRRTDPPAPRPAGSSPLARGLLDYSPDHDDAVGIIPARAGFTGDPVALRRHHKDHPRSRGVYRRKVRDGRIPAGSSPLARGLRSL